MLCFISITHNLAIDAMQFFLVTVVMVIIAIITVGLRSDIMITVATAMVAMVPFGLAPVVMVTVAVATVFQNRLL